MGIFFNNNQRYEYTTKMATNCFKILVCSVIFLRIVNGSSCKNEPKCMITRSHGMKAADCYSRDFKVFPKCVPNDVEVLELSYNRLRKIGRSEIGQFSSLRILYLSENFLVNLDEDTFNDLDDLTVLDLSLNGIVKLPTQIFQLPSLEKLYIKQNQNMNLADALEKVKLILSPLTFLDISFTTDEDNLQEFPNFRLMPYLRSLNITGNTYTLLLPSHFAGLCKLTKLFSENATAAFDDPCDCWKINDWLMKRNVDFKAFMCPGLKKNCPSLSIQSEDLEVFTECMETYKQIESKIMMTRVFIGLGSSLCVLLILIMFYLIIFRKYSCKKKKDDDKRFKNLAVRANLLNDSSHKNTENVYM